MSVTMMVGVEKNGNPNVSVITWPGVKDPIFMETSHVGLVLGVEERNGYDDSDFYAIVWDPVKGCPDRIEYATTRGWTYPNHASVDASPDVKAAYQRYLNIEAVKAQTLADEIEAKKPGIGKKVRVVRGRKVKIGTEGVIFWSQEQTFTPRFKHGWRKGPDTVKIGIAITDERNDHGRLVNVVWTYAKNVEVVI